MYIATSYPNYQEPKERRIIRKKNEIIATQHVDSWQSRVALPTRFLLSLFLEIGDEIKLIECLVNGHKTSHSGVSPHGRKNRLGFDIETK